MHSVATSIPQARELSPNKLHANRQNARRSTGPRTPAGKARSSRNAISHGLFADDHLILPGESKEEHDNIRDTFLVSLRPTDAIEHSIIERMIAARWRLRRLRDKELEAYEKGARQIVNDREASYRATLPTLKPKELAPFEAASRARAETDWQLVESAKVSLHLFAEFAAHEKRLEDQFYKAQRELRLWRKENRVAAARGFTDESAPDEEFPDNADECDVNETPDSQNEPTAPTSDATQAPIELCEPPLNPIAPSDASQCIIQAAASAIEPFTRGIQDST